MHDLFINLVYDTLLLVATIAAGYVLAWLRRHIGVEKLAQIQTELATKQELAGLAVRFVEQVYRDLHGEQKYQKAAEWLTQRALDLGISTTPEEIKGLIEAALRAFKDQFGEEWAKAVSPK
jgi:LL-H family phage holin